MKQTLSALRCSAAGFVLLHASDLSPVWLIEPYRRFVSGLVFANRFTAAAFLVAIAISVATLMICSAQYEARLKSRA